MRLWRDRTLVKAWTVRGTLHLHPAAELPLWYAARSAMDAGDAGRPAAVARSGGRASPGARHGDEVDDDLRRGVARRSTGAACCARSSSRRWPGERGRPRASGCAPASPSSAATSARGRRRETRSRSPGPDQWVEGWQEVDPEEALREVCRRYLHTYGPARRMSSASGSAPQLQDRGRAQRSSSRSATSRRSKSKDTTRTSSRETPTFPSRWRVSGFCPSTTCTSWASASATTSCPTRREPRLRHTVAGSTRDRRAFAFC